MVCALWSFPALGLIMCDEFPVRQYRLVSNLACCLLCEVITKLNWIALSKWWCCVASSCFEAYIFILRSRSKKNLCKPLIRNGIFIIPVYFPVHRLSPFLSATTLHSESNKCWLYTLYNLCTCCLYVSFQTLWSSLVEFAERSIHFTKDSNEKANMIWP